MLRLVDCPSWLPVNEETPPRLSTPNGLGALPCQHAREPAYLGAHLALSWAKTVCVVVPPAALPVCTVSVASLQPTDHHCV
jgi:hypothetical protein